MSKLSLDTNLKADKTVVLGSNQIKKTLDNIGGRLEWATDIGLGLSFALSTTDDVIEELREAILRAVWISFDETQSTDLTLALLERSSVLEFLSLKSTLVTHCGSPQAP